MDIWEEKLAIPKSFWGCKRTGTCCQTATSVQPWQKINSAKNDQDLKDFFNIFTPYPSHIVVEERFPEAYEACMEVAESREGLNKEDIFFYHCRFLKYPSTCLIYEDRPTLCRDYPDSPFDSIPSTCGYYSWAIQCRKRVRDIQLDLMNMKHKEFRNYKFYLLSPAASWIK